jgi:hypothetical protein
MKKFGLKNVSNSSNNHFAIQCIVFAIIRARFGLKLETCAYLAADKPANLN